MNLESEISLLEEQLRIAMLRSDLSALDALIADDLLFVAPDGSVIGKAEDWNCTVPEHSASHNWTSLIC